MHGKESIEIYLKHSYFTYDELILKAQALHAKTQIVIMSFLIWLTLNVIIHVVNASDEHQIILISFHSNNDAQQVACKQNLNVKLSKVQTAHGLIGCSRTPESEKSSLLFAQCYILGLLNFLLWLFY